MYMRIVRGQPPEGHVEELAKKWAAFFPERLRAVPGFQHAHCGIDRASGAVAGVTIFDQPPDEARFAQLMGEFQATLGAAAPAQRPESSVYEIVTEV